MDLFLYWSRAYGISSHFVGKKILGQLDRVANLESRALLEEDRCLLSSNAGRHSSQLDMAIGSPMVKVNSVEISALYNNVFVAVVSEVNLAAEEKNWVVDSGATRHICNDELAFSAYIKVKDGEEQVCMGDSCHVPVKGKGKIYLKLASGKTLALTNVLHIPEIRSNLISVSLLQKVGIKVAFETDINDVQKLFKKSKVYKDSQEVVCEDSQQNPEYSEIEIQRSKRERKSTNFGDNFYTFLLDNDPVTYNEAICSRDAPFWKDAINSEMNSIISNHTWEVVYLPHGAKPIGCKWIFKRKLKVDCSVEKYQARLVANRFTQKKDIDYCDTFAPVTRISSIIVLMSLTAIHNFFVHQMDVKTAFLYGDLDEKICMNQPEGTIVPRNEQKACKLIKSLYGLKQAPKQ
ncbi:uncharacterized protein LOC109846220 [Asparagus officinalis]|uniref:uncharacterized protein LOC109846220 n=1 Tax=Asparagus officinalis TaxID=4686 RepID=UPI00098E806A|nr:uncharacterized protein LOC109846220 [Asparagus officinalis]